MLFFLAVPQVPAAFPRIEALPSSAEVPLNGNAQLPWRASLPGILAGEQPERSRKNTGTFFCTERCSSVRKNKRLPATLHKNPHPEADISLTVHHTLQYPLPLSYKKHTNSHTNRNIAPYFYLYYVIFKKILIIFPS